MISVEKAIDILKDMQCRDGLFYCELSNNGFPCDDPCEEYQALQMAINVLEEQKE